MWYNRLKIGKDDVGSIIEPTSSLVWADVILAVFRRLYLTIYETLLDIFSVQLNDCNELYLC